MKNPITKSMLRSPLKTILKIGIISLALYFFISSAVKLLVVNTETERIGSYYKSIGQLQPIKDPTNREDYLLKPELKKLLNESEYVDLENVEWVVHSVSPDSYNRNYNIVDTYPSEEVPYVFYPDSDINIGDFIFIGRVESITKL